MYSIISNSPFFTILLSCLIIVILVEICAQLKNTIIKETLIIGFSIFLLWYMDWRSLVILSTLAAAVYIIILSGINVRKRALLISSALILLLLFLKDLAFFTGLASPYVPLGVSYYFFRLIALFLEFAKSPDKVRESLNLRKYLTWIFFFPIFFAGPIQRFHLFKEIPSAEHETRRAHAYLLLCIFLGFKFFIVDSILFPFAYKELLPPLLAGSGSSLSIYIFGLSAFTHAYMDLMIYTEVSKKVGWILGYKIQENFNFPLLASNISQFWQRYHMSLSTWTRDYVFFPLAAKTRNFGLATYSSMITMGLWHDLSLNWLAWALCHGSLLNLYNILRQSTVYRKLIKNEVIQKILRLGGIAFTISFVSSVFILVSIPDFKTSVALLMRMLGVL